MTDRTNPGYYAKHKWSILAVLVFMPFMATLDGTVVNVALPVMVKDLHSDMESIQMVVIAYLIAVVASILLFGRLGDIKGKGRLFLFGTFVFTAGSLMAGLSRDLNTLIVSRVIEGIGGAAAMANNQGIITEVFPSSQRGRALGISGVFVALGTMLGPPVGGLIVTYLNWNYIFLINVPIGVVAFLLGLRLLPWGNRTKEQVDYAGTILLAGAILAFFYGLLTGQSNGYGRADIIIAFILSAFLLVLFLRREKKNEQPILDLQLFRNPIFTLSIVCVLMQFIATSGISIIQPFYVEDVLALNAAQTGLIMMSFPIVMGIVSPLSGYISDKIGSAALTLVGLVIMTVGIFLLSTLNAASSVATLVTYLCIVGLGAGIFSAPNTSMIMSTAPKGKLGITGSVNAFMRNFGSVTGISVFTTLLYAMMSSQVGHQVKGYVSGRPDVFVNAMQTVYLVGTALLAGGVILTAVRLVKNKRLKSAVPADQDAAK